MQFLGFLSVALTLSLPRATSSIPLRQVACEARVETTITTGRTETRIQCVNIGVNGLPLDVALSRTPFFDTLTDQFSDFAQLANTVTVLEVSANGDVTITKNGLAALPNLVHLEIDSENKRRDHLTISSTEFRNTPRLTSLHIGGFTVANSTIQAIGNLKNKLESLGISDCAPGKRLLKQVAKFTNLKYNVEFGSICDDGPFPALTLKKSGATLRTIRVENCNLPKIPANMFRGMRNLRYLHLSSSKVTMVDAGAFDDLVALNYLNLNGNKIKTLPDGLFRNTRNLLVVDLEKNEVENVSRKNFTHCVHFERLQLLV